MNPSTKQAQLDKTTAQLNEWSASAGLLKAKVEKASASFRLSLHQRADTGLASVKTGVTHLWNDAAVVIASLKGKKHVN